MTRTTQEPVTPWRDRVSELIASATLEVIPLHGAEGQVLSAPRSTTITVTCSPKFGLERTLVHVAAATEKGNRVVPHVAARMVPDRTELRRFVSRIEGLGVDDLYVIGGDAEEPLGIFGSAGDLLNELSCFDHGLRRIGVACYPEGHPRISDDRLLEALLAKQIHADYMVSQLCFDSRALVRWIEDARASGVSLPMRIGLAAPIKMTRLIELSLRIGVGQSLRYLTKQHGMVGHLMLGRSYAPETLLLEMGERLATAEDLGIEGLHIFTFNQVDITVGWQRRISQDGL